MKMLIIGATAAAAAVFVFDNLPSVTAQMADPAEPPRPATQPAGGGREIGGMLDRAAEQGQTVFVDDSFTSIEELRKANRLAGQGQNQLAITTYQQIIEKFGQKLVYLNNDAYVSITDYVREKLLGMPAVREGMYDQLYGAAAERDIQTAIEQRDLSELIRLCDRFYPSTAAYKGLSTAAEWYFERAEFASASRTWQLLLAHPQATKEQATLLFRAAVAERLSGREAAAKKLATQLTAQHAQATGEVDGQTVVLSEKLATVLKQPAWEQAILPADEWPTFQGSPDRTTLANVNSTAGARLWSVQMDDDAIGGEGFKKRATANSRNREALMRRYGNAQPQNTGPALSSHVVLSNGSLFVHTGERIVSLSANAGTVLWGYPQQAGNFRDEEEQRMMNMYGMRMRVPAHDVPTVFEDQVFAVLPAPAAPVDPNMANRGWYGGQPAGNTRLVALNRQTGKEAWSRVASDIKVEGKGNLTFMGSPVVTRQGVFIMARNAAFDSFTRLYMVRLDRQSGAVSWVCYLCSTSSGGYYGYMTPQNPTIPALADDVVYVSTGQGADCAIDANAGRIMWLSINESSKKQRNPNEYYQPNMETTPSWRINPPLVWADKLVTFEPGGNVRIYDRWQGKLHRAIARKDLGDADMTAGIVGGRLITVGKQIVATDIETTKRVWVADAPDNKTTGRMMGRPFMALNLLYVPFEKGLLMVNTASDAETRIANFTVWPKVDRTDKEEFGKPGNLLVTSEQVIVINDDEIAGYSRWETARDNRLARIKAEPNNPEPYLALSEIAFRTNHMDVAKENMKKGVELIAAPEAKANAELVGRFYRTSLNFAEQLLGKNEVELRDQSRFFFEQAKVTARDSEQQAEWRLSMAQLARAQKQFDEAAQLYAEVLVDSGMRAAQYRRGDQLSRAGVSAESSMRTLLELSADSYKRFEEQAAALLARSRDGKDVSALLSIIESFPNSKSAQSAAGIAAKLYAERGDFDQQIKTLLWLYRRVPSTERGAITSDLAVANLNNKRFAAAVGWTERGLRQFKDHRFAHEGKTISFADFRQQLASSGLAASEGRRPSLPEPPRGERGTLGNARFDNASVMKINASGEPENFTVSQGRLLTPVETQLAYRRPEGFFTWQSGSLSMYTAGSANARWTLDLPVRTNLMMLGHAGKIAVLAHASGIIGVDVESGKVAWTRALTVAPEDLNRAAENAERIRNNALARGAADGRFVGGQVMINGQMMVMDVNGNYVPVSNMTGPDAEAARATAIASLGRPSFSTLRMVGNRVIAALPKGAGSELAAFDVTTGEPAWKNGENAVRVAMPDGLTTVLSGTEDRLVAQVDEGAKGTSTLVVVETDSGKWRRQLKVDDDRVLWRTVSEDGTLFVVTNDTVCAFDLFAEQDQPIWRRDNLRTRHPGATALTLDGLVIVNTQNELVCVATDSGETRWPLPPQQSARLEIPQAQGQLQSIRATVDGDNIIYQAPTGMAVYRSTDGELQWRTVDISNNPTPPLQSVLLSEPYVIGFAMGPVQNATRAVQFMLYERKGGKLCLNQPLTRSVGTREGPQVNNWQVIDDGIVFELGGGKSTSGIYVLKAQK